MMVSEILPHLDENGDIRLNPLFEFREDENSTLQHVSGALVRTEKSHDTDGQMDTCWLPAGRHPDSKVKVIGNREE